MRCMCKMKFNYCKLFEILSYKYSHNRRCYQTLSLGVIGAPFSRGQSKRGTHLAPKAMRSAGLIERLRDIGHDVTDWGDLLLPDNARDERPLNDSPLKNAFTVADMCAKVSQSVRDMARDGRVAITLGGDHSIAIGTISGNRAVNEQMCVLWVDAHADINTALTSTSGHFHGMPVSFLLKDVVTELDHPNQSCAQMSTIYSLINKDVFAYVGLRDLEKQEINILKQLNILNYTMSDIDRHGIYEVMSRTLDQINPKLNRKIHVSFDIDAVDQMLAPSTGVPVPSGLTTREAISIGEIIAETKMLCGIDMVEINPLIGTQDDVNKTINCAINILLAFLGKTRHAFVRT